jgi:hypothetical protein
MPRLSIQFSFLTIVLVPLKIVVGTIVQVSQPDGCRDCEVDFNNWDVVAAAGPSNPSLHHCAQTNYEGKNFDFSDNRSSVHKCYSGCYYIYQLHKIHMLYGYHTIPDNYHDRVR